MTYETAPVPVDSSAAPAPTVPPVCPRHPDRVSFVKCQRCGQPVCPECMRSAAVGVQCVDCVQGHQKALRVTRRNAIGALAIEKPTVTYAVIGLCAAMFVLQLVVGNSWTNRFAFSPAIGAIEPWRFLTSAFLHSPGFIGHILFNMWAFWQCGQLLERTLGHARFVTLCLVTALGGSVGFLLLAGAPGSAGWATPVVGASGMVFGLFGALIPIMRTAGQSARQIWVLIAINAVLGFVVRGIAWQAHLGGLLVGLAMSWGYTHWARNRPAGAGGKDYRKLIAWAMPIGIVALLAIAVYVRYETTGWLDVIRQLP